MKIRILYFPVIFLITACSFEQSHEHEGNHINNETGDHVHQHDEVKLQITAYSTDFEVFAEADPFVAGQESEILAHFSTLPGFRAVEEAVICLRLKTPGNVDSLLLHKPLRKGIFHFSIIPQKAGAADMEFDIMIPGMDNQIIRTVVEVFKNNHDAVHNAEEKEIQGLNPVVFTKEQSWKIDFATSLPEFGPFGEHIETSAIVRNLPENEAFLPAATEGIVVFNNLAVIEGLEVRKDQVLFSLTGSGMAEGNIELKFREAKLDFEKSEKNYERIRELYKEKITTEKQLLEAKTDFENANLVYQNLLRNFDYSGQQIVSPFDGYISEVLVENGQYVERGQRLLRIVRPGELLLHAEVPSGYYQNLGNIVDVSIKPDGQEDYLSLSELNGKILSYGKSAGNPNFLIPVHISIQQDATIIPGTFCKIIIKTRKDENLISVPESALIEEQGNYFVLVQLHPELFEKRQVKVGESDGKYVEIISGLEKSERIISRGTTIVRLASSTGAMDAHAGHVH